MKWDSRYLAPGLAGIGLAILGIIQFWPDQLNARGWAAFFLYGVGSIPAYVLAAQAAKGWDKWFSWVCLAESVLILRSVPALGGGAVILGVSLPRWLLFAGVVVGLGFAVTHYLDRAGWIRR
jgi:hypothetical protein